MRTRIALLLATLFAVALSVFAAAPANAASGNCGSRAWSSDRVCLIAYGSGNVSYAILHVHTGSDGHDYADGEAMGAPGSNVYFDISRNGGSTWSGWNYVGSNYAGYWTGFYPTGTVYDGPGYWVRVCAVGSDNRYVCTGWN